MTKDSTGIPLGVKIVIALAMLCVVAVLASVFLTPLVTYFVVSSLPPLDESDQTPSTQPETSSAFVELSTIRTGLQGGGYISVRPHLVLADRQSQPVLLENKDAITKSITTLLSATPVARLEGAKERATLRKAIILDLNAMLMKQGIPASITDVYFVDFIIQ